MGGDLIQEDSGCATSLVVENIFQIQMEGKENQRIELAYPESVTLGTMDFRESAGVKIVPDEIHGRELSGFEKIVWKERQEFYLSSVSLRKDETIHCGTVEWHGGRISANWYDLTVKGNMEVTDSSRLNVNSGKIIVEKDLTIKDGGMEVLGDSQLHVGGDLRIGEQGQLSTDWTGGGNPDLYVQENLVVDSLKQTNLKYGTLFLEGDLIQEDSGYETSLNVMNNFSIQFEGKEIQSIELAYPDRVSLGKINFQNSTAVKIVPDEIHGYELSGFEKIVWKERQEFYLSSVSLRKDETIHCGTVEWHGGRISANWYDLTVKGNMEVTDSSRLNVNSGKIIVEKDLTIKDGGMEVLGDSQLHVGGDLRIGEQGQLSTDWTGGGNPDLYVQENLVVNSLKQTNLKYGTLFLEGDLIQEDSGYETSLNVTNNFRIECVGEGIQTIDLAYPDCVPLGTMDFRNSMGVEIVADEIHGRELIGFEKIVWKEKQKFYLTNVSLRKDETIHCETVDWHVGRLSVGQYHLTVKGNLEMTGSSRLDVNSGTLTVEKNLTIKDGKMDVLGDSQLHVKGDFRIGEQGQLSTDWTGGGNPDLYVQENLVVNSLKQTNLKYGTLFLEGDLIQEDSGYETSLNVTNNFRIECVGEEIQTIDLAYPDCVPLGTMDFRNSMGVEIVADEIHGRELIGFEKIVWKEKQKFYLTNVSLRKDETIHCETVDWHVGRLSVGQYHLTVKGNLEMTGSSRLDVNSGTLTVEKNLTIKDGKMDVLGDSQLHVKGDFRIGEQGQLSTDWTGSGYPELYVQGDMVVNSAKQSILKYGTLRLEGDFVQIDDSDIENLKIEYAFNVVLEGKNRQTINLEGVESIPDLDLSESKEVYLAGDYSGRELEGVEKIVCDGETVYLDYTEAVTSSDGTIDGSLKCYGKLIVNWHTLTIKGKYTQYGGTLVKNGGKLVTAGDFTAAKAEVELEDGTIHVKGDTNIKKNACINMRAFEKSHFRTDGDYTSASRRDDYSTGGGTLEVKGDLIKEDSATSFGLYLSGTHLFFSGSHEQSVKTKDAEFGSVASIDMRQSDVVSFSCRSIHTMKIRGFSHIKTDESNNALMLCNSSIHLEEDDSYNGDIMLFNSNFDCNGKSFHISGSLEQTDSTMILNGGGLYIGKHYSIMGNGYLRMTQESELLHVDGTFSTCAEQSHDRLLTNGRMELGGNFNQTGNENSFKTTGGFVIAFIGEKEQLVCFKTYEYAGFANIDPKYNEFMRTEEPDELMDRVIYRISKGFISGLKEASGIEILEDIANNYAMLLGIGTLVAASVVFWPVGLVLSVCIAIYSIFIIAKSAGGIYSTLTGDGDIYDKAEAFGHDAALMLVSVFFLKGSVDGMAKNISACKNAVKGLIGRIKRFNLLEFLGTATSYETIVDYESFIKYASEFAEADALSYIKTVAKETDSIETLKKVGKLLEEGKGKLGRLLKLDEVKVGVETLLEGGDVAKALAAVEEFKAGGYITNIVDDIDNIAQEIIDINKKYSDGFEMNNSVHNILNSASYYDDPYEQVAAVIRSISDHAFANGNKRTAFDTLNLLLNKLRLKDILTDAQKWDLIYDIAEGRIKNVKNIASILSGK